MAMNDTIDELESSRRDDPVDQLQCIEESIEDNAVDLLLDVQERGNRFGIKQKKASALTDSGDGFHAISNFIIEIKGEVRAAKEGSSLTGYVCEVIFHNGRKLG